MTLILNRDRLSDANVKVFEAKTSLVVSEANVKSFFFRGEIILCQMERELGTVGYTASVRRCSRPRPVSVSAFPFGVA